MHTEPGSIHMPRKARASGALPCPAERCRPVREDAGRRWRVAERLSALFCAVRLMQMRESVILRYKAAQHTKNRADVRKTEGTGKAGIAAKQCAPSFWAPYGPVQPACAGTAAVRAGCAERRRPEGGVRAVWTGRASKWEWGIFCLAEHSERRRCGTAGRRHGARARRRCRQQAKP